MKGIDKIRSILIVEDDHRLALEWQTELLAKGYKVDSVSGADDAILLLKNNYDCFILDLFHFNNNKMLPDGGIKCIGHIRRYESAFHNRKKSLIITVTGFFRNEKHLGTDTLMPTNTIVESLGADFTLKKPIDISAILEIMRKVESKSRT